MTLWRQAGLLLAVATILLTLEPSGASSAWKSAVSPWGVATNACRGGFFDSTDEYDYEEDEQEKSENKTVEDSENAASSEDVFQDSYQELPEKEEQIELVVSEDEEAPEMEKIATDENEDEEEASDDNEVSNVEVEAFIEDPVAEEESASFTSGTVADDPTIDDDSSAFVDRMELADAYDEGETTPGSFEVESAATTPGDTPTTPKVTEKGAPVLSATAIDAAMRKVLIKELNYRRKEVNMMKPEIASMVVEKRMRRPEEGIPKNFIRTDLPKKGDLMKVLPKIIVGGAVVVAAVLNGDKIESLQQKLGSFDSLIFDNSVVTEEPVAAAPVETAVEYASTEEDYSLKHGNEHVDDLTDVHPHSVKPGKPVNDQLDVTWLDKAITFVENKIKAFLRMEI